MVSIESYISLTNQKEIEIIINANNNSFPKQSFKSFFKELLPKNKQKNILNLKCFLHVDNIITDLNTSLIEVIPFSNNYQPYYKFEPLKTN